MELCGPRYFASLPPLGIRRANEKSILWLCVSANSYITVGFGFMSKAHPSTLNMGHYIEYDS